MRICVVGVPVWVHAQSNRADPECTSLPLLEALTVENASIVVLVAKSKTSFKLFLEAVLNVVCVIQGKEIAANKAAELLALLFNTACESFEMRVWPCSLVIAKLVRVEQLMA